MEQDRWQRISQVLEKSLECEPGQRGRFLDEACGGDEELRREVESLLAFEPQLKNYLEQPVLKGVSEGPTGQQKRSWVGRQIGVYRIESLLGAGGMGEVYRALDTRLDRMVAIKVLPDAFTRDAERLARFEREAKLLASLNHPNIGAIYGVEQAEGKNSLVLEYVDGETLAERLEKGALGIEEALGICRQIAEGLEADHEKGIIHRDLKPANVKITAEGKVKILDFGLAKAYQKEGTVPDLSKSPTISHEMTGRGVILGTAAYMSPEQATGRGVDKRADVRAFGCVLFECLTGKRAFPGETITETLAAILRGEPDWQALPVQTPRKVKELLQRCLRKDPRERLHDIADARIEIGETLNQPEEVVSFSRRMSLRWLVSLIALTLIAGALIGYGLMKLRKPVSQAAVVRSIIKLEPGQWLVETQRIGRTAMAISSDGGFIIYSAVKVNPGPQDNSRLYLRRTDQTEGRPIAGTEGAFNPFISPDNKWVGFQTGSWEDGKLMKVSIDGGVPAALCAVGLLCGASWDLDNSIVFSPDSGSGLLRVSADGGKPEILTTPDKAKEEFGHGLPHHLPNGKGVLFTTMRELHDLHPRLALLDLKTRQWRILLEDAADARCLPTGHLVFLRQGTLMAVPFDLQRLEVNGQPVPIISNVMQALTTKRMGVFNTGAGQLSVSDTGWLVYAVEKFTPYAENSLIWWDQKDGAQSIVPFEAPFLSPRLSPDGQRIAYTRESQIWVYNLVRDTASRLTGEGKSNFVTWTPDGKRLVFNWLRSGQYNLFWQSADGSSPMEQLTTSDYTQIPGSFSPDGATLAFVELHPDTIWDIYLLDMRTRRVTPLLISKTNEINPEFSPDGRWLAYYSEESGRGELYVRPFPGLGGKWQISSQGAWQHLWSRNGKQLFYTLGKSASDQEVWGVDVRTTDAFSASKPRLLFKAPRSIGSGPVRGWDIAADSQRFLMVKSEETEPQPVTELILVQNWFEELKRLAPTPGSRD